MKVNKALLKEWLAKEKETNPHARADLCIAARISPSTLDKIASGYIPGPQARFMLAHATGLNEDELFTKMDEAA